LTAAIGLVAGVNQHRLAGRRDDEGRGAAFNVYPIDIESARLRDERDRRDEQREKHQPHHNGLLSRGPDYRMMGW
jgi:hypothetical protein